MVEERTVSVAVEAGWVVTPEREGSDGVLVRKVSLPVEVQSVAALGTREKTVSALRRERSVAALIPERWVPAQAEAEEAKALLPELSVEAPGLERAAGEPERERMVLMSERERSVLVPAQMVVDLRIELAVDYHDRVLPLRSRQNHRNCSRNYLHPVAEMQESVRVLKV